jgi:hypothetical protein
LISQPVPIGRRSGGLADAPTRSAGATIELFACLGTSADGGQLGKRGRLSGGPVVTG